MKEYQSDEARKLQGKEVIQQVKAIIHHTFIASIKEIDRSYCRKHKENSCIGDVLNKNKNIIMEEFLSLRQIFSLNQNIIHIMQIQKDFKGAFTHRVQFTHHKEYYFVY